MPAPSLDMLSVKLIVYLCDERYRMHVQLRTLTSEGLGVIGEETLECSGTASGMVLLLLLRGRGGLAPAEGESDIQA